MAILDLCHPQELLVEVCSSQHYSGSSGVHASSDGAQLSRPSYCRHHLAQDCCLDGGAVNGRPNSSSLLWPHRAGFPYPCSECRRWDHCHSIPSTGHALGGWLSMGCRSARNLRCTDRELLTSSFLGSGEHGYPTLGCAQTPLRRFVQWKDQAFHDFMIPVEQLHAIEDELQGKMQRWIKQVIRTIMRQNPGHTLDEWLELIEQPVDLEDPAQGHQGEPWLIAALQETGLPDFPLPILFLHWGVAPPLRVTSYERASDAGIDLPGYSSIFEHTLLWIMLEDFDFIWWRQLDLASLGWGLRHGASTGTWPTRNHRRQRCSSTVRAQSQSAVLDPWLGRWYKRAQAGAGTLGISAGLLHGQPPLPWSSYGYPARGWLRLHDCRWSKQEREHPDVRLARRCSYWCAFGFGTNSTCHSMGCWVRVYQAGRWHRDHSASPNFSAPCCWDRRADHHNMAGSRCGLWSVHWPASDAVFGLDGDSPRSPDSIARPSRGNDSSEDQRCHQRWAGATLRVPSADALGFGSSEPLQPTINIGRDAPRTGGPYTPVRGQVVETPNRDWALLPVDVAPGAEIGRMEFEHFRLWWVPSSASARVEIWFYSLRFGIFEATGVVQYSIGRPVAIPGPNDVRVFSTRSRRQFLTDYSSPLFDPAQPNGLAAVLARQNSFIPVAQLNVGQTFGMVHPDNVAQLISGRPDELPWVSKTSKFTNLVNLLMGKSLRNFFSIFLDMSKFCEKRKVHQKCIDRAVFS